VENLYPLLDQIQEVQPPVAVFLGDGDNQPKVRHDHGVPGVLGDSITRQEPPGHVQEGFQRVVEPVLDLDQLAPQVNKSALDLSDIAPVARPSQPSEALGLGDAHSLGLLGGAQNDVREGADLLVAENQGADGAAHSDPRPGQPCQRPSVRAPAGLDLP
jgi:hypothetical protein